MEEVSGGPEISGNKPANGCCILYQNEAQRITLLDLPRSIAAAQARHRQQSFQGLLSCEPLAVPYPNVDPKSDRASRRLGDQASSLTEATKHIKLIHAGLEDIRGSRQGPWCLPRSVQSCAGGFGISNRKRKAHGTTAEAERREPQLPFGPLIGVATCTKFPSLQTLSIPSSEALQNQCFLNPHSSPSSLHISSTNATYPIPPRSSFISTTLSANTSSLLSIALLAAAPNATSSTQPGKFDLIILDPPWPNRSARRSAAYKHASNIEDPLYGFGEILPQHLAASGIVACWTTQSQAVRKTVESCFDDWSVDLVEEWTWAKVTKHGEPVVALDSLWRRSWEVLLIGRKRDDEQIFGSCEEPVHRLIVAVPDLHSRKPCLKELFEQVLLHRTDARVLEVFARHLVAGWCSVGDEILRFNWEGHWMDSPSVPCI